MKSRAYIYIMAGAALWGLLGVFVRSLAARGFTPMQIVALRAGVSALFSTVLALRAGTVYFRIAWRDCWLFAGSGIIGQTCFQYFYFNCINVNSLATAALLLYTAPVFVMLMALVFFRERFTPAKGAALLAAFVGCACVTGVFSSSLRITPEGLFYGLGSGLGYALYSIFAKIALRKYAAPTITLYTFYFSVASAVPLAGFSGGRSGQWSLPAVAALAGLGLLCSVLPYLLYNRGLQEVEAGRASILATVEPLVAALAGIFIFAEPLTLEKCAGMCLILASAVILHLAAPGRGG